MTSSIKEFLGCAMCRQVSDVNIHGTDGACYQEAEAQDEEMMECQDSRVFKRIPTERIATALMRVGLSGPAVVCDRKVVI